MLKLNLISQELKKEIKLRRLYGSLKRIYALLIIVTATAAIMLLTARVILQNNFNKVVEQTTLITKNSQSYNIKVREINSQLSSIEKIQNDFIFWSRLLGGLTEEVKDDITFYYLGLDKNTKTLKLKGVSATRESLLAFKENLEKSTVFDGIDFPLTNILQKNNINFEIAAKLNLNNL